MSERGSGSAGQSESARAERLSAARTPTELEQDERGVDDPARLAEERAAQIAQQAAEIRGAKVPIETEPPTTFRP